jgi:serine-type D-Ala-D-Ala carboxypeptidase (penicillin-binding protein 5/6)
LKCHLVAAAAAVLATATLGSASPTIAASASAQAAEVQRVVVNGTIHRPRTDVPAPPRMRAKAWIVVDMSTGRVLGKHRARARLPQASTIKLLTALTATHRVDAERPVRASRLAASTICSCAGVKAGRRYTRSMLLGGMLIKSGNDAAEALAGGDPRGRGRFIAGMNNTAERLGASDTDAKNPSGLDQAGGHSSARDLLVLLRAAASRPAIADWLDTPSMRFGPVGGRRHRLESTTDYLLLYADSYAAKNGYTSRAGNTLAVATHLRSRRIGVAILGAQAGYTTSGARKLTVWAANNAVQLAPLGRLPGS